MAQPTNTFDTYDAVGIREDLSNVIYSVTPDACGLKLYEGLRIRELVACGLELDACGLGLDACRLKLESL